MAKLKKLRKLPKKPKATSSGATIENYFKRKSIVEKHNRTIEAENKKTIKLREKLRSA